MPWCCPADSGSTTWAGARDARARICRHPVLDVWAPDENCETSERILVNLEPWVLSGSPDIVHLNFRALPPLGMRLQPVGRFPRAQVIGCPVEQLAIGGHQIGAQPHG